MLRKVLRFLLEPQFSILEAVFIGLVFYCVDGSVSTLTGAMLVAGFITLGLLDRFFGSRGD